MENENEVKQETDGTGFKEEFQKIKDEFEQKLAEQQKNFDAQIKERNDIIQQLISESKAKQEPEEQTELEKMVARTIELVNKRRK